MRFGGYSGEGRRRELVGVRGEGGWRMVDVVAGAASADERDERWVEDGLADLAEARALAADYLKLARRERRPQMAAAAAPRGGGAGGDGSPNR